MSSCSFFISFSWLCCWLQRWPDVMYCLLHNSPGFVLRVSENSCCYAQQQGQQNSHNLRRSRYSILQHVGNNCFHHHGCSLALAFFFVVLLCFTQLFSTLTWSFVVAPGLLLYLCRPAVSSLTASWWPQMFIFLSKSKYMMVPGYSSCKAVNVKQKHMSHSNWNVLQWV